MPAGWWVVVLGTLRTVAGMAGPWERADRGRLPDRRELSARCRSCGPVAGKIGRVHFSPSPARGVCLSYTLGCRDT